MKQIILSISLILNIATLAIGQKPNTISGQIKHIENFKSKYVDNRNIDIWLPDGYNRNKKHNVIYMHDGQMLFDANITWNNKEWKVDETFTELIKEGTIEGCIIVGIWNNGDKRIAEYLPNDIYNELDSSFKAQLSSKYLNGGNALSDKYLQFVVSELKPYIDTTYSVYTDQAHTFMIGSSMGGIVSIYAISKYPNVFAGVACMSTAWLSQVGNNMDIPNATAAFLSKHLTSLKDHKIYMDYGTGESDESYIKTQSEIDSIIKSKSYSESNFMSIIYNNDIHNEECWAKRLYIPVTFLLNND